MGTTVTTNLGLIKPDGNEKIEEDLPTFAGWAAQNGVNCDKVDSLFRAAGTTYTPTFTTTGGSLIYGAAGGVVGKYIRLYPAMVLGHFTFNIGGAGFSAAAGVFTMTAPVAPHPDILTLATWIPVGKAIYQRNAAVANSSVFEVIYDIGSSVLVFRCPDATSFSTTNPVALAQLDKLSGYFMYPTSAA